MKKAAIYNPYWDTLGGGEKYTATVARCFLDKKIEVDIEWRDKKLAHHIKSRFNIHLESAKIVDSIKRGDGYDYLFWVSDGSIPTLRARNNILHFQFPFQNVGGRSLMNKMKLFRVNSIVVNSHFTKGFIDKEFSVNSIVIYPPIDTKLFTAASKKEKILLYVGRFSQLTQNKNQHILVNVFKKIYDSGYRDWKLVLAGGGEVGADTYIETLRKKAVGYPISIVISPSFNEIKKLYGSSTFFVSAVGIDVDENKEPLKVEHFGMTLVEAMSAGVVPIVPLKGGYKEIISEDNGVTYTNENELYKILMRLLSLNPEVKKLASQAQKDAILYDTSHFISSFDKLL